MVLKKTKRRVALQTMSTEESCRSRLKSCEKKRMACLSGKSVTTKTTKGLQTFFKAVTDIEKRAIEEEKRNRGKTFQERHLKCKYFKRSNAVFCINELSGAIYKYANTNNVEACRSGKNKKKKKYYGNAAKKETRLKLERQLLQHKLPSTIYKAAIQFAIRKGVYTKRPSRSGIIVRKNDYNRKILRRKKN